MTVPAAGTKIKIPLIEPSAKDVKRVNLYQTMKRRVSLVRQVSIKSSQQQQHIAARRVELASTLLMPRLFAKIVKPVATKRIPKRQRTLARHVELASTLSALRLCAKVVRRVSIKSLEQQLHTAARRAAKGSTLQIHSKRVLVAWDERIKIWLRLPSTLAKRA